MSAAEGPGGGPAAARAAFARAWRPISGHFDDALREATGTEALAEAARALLADDAWTGAIVDAIAAALRADPFFIPPFRTVRNDIRSGLVILDRPGLVVTLDVVHAADLASRKDRPRAGSVTLSGEISLLKFVRAGGATLSLWEAPPIGLDFRAAGAGACRETGRRAIADGDLLTIDGRRASFVVEAARANLLIVHATVRTEAPVSVEFDVETGGYLGCAATADSDSRLQLIATAARLLDAAEAFPAIAALLDHPSFFVRWHAMRELIGIDAEAALPYLRLLATNDPHDEVRAAAEATLAMIAPPAAGRKAA